MRICVLLHDEASQFEHYGVEFRCSSGRHHHYSRQRADELVKAGQAVWVGKHKRRVRMLKAKTWSKVYPRNRANEATTCTLQMTDRRAALFIPSRPQYRRVKPGPVREVKAAEGLVEVGP